jgi:hypothetical protein
MDGSGPDVFSSVWDIEIDTEGSLYVLDRTANEVRAFDRDGVFLGSMGRRGEGPGEFLNPFGLAWGPSGNLWVVDVQRARYSVFSREGEHLREFRRSVGGFSWPWPGRFANDGRLYESSLARDAGRLVGFELSDELIPVDSFPLVALEQTGFWNLQDERGLGAVVQIPFAGLVEWVLDNEPMLWTGKTDTYSIVRRRLGGDTVLVIERDVAPVAVSSDEREAVIEELGDYAQHPRMDLTRIPEVKPSFRRIMPDDDGNLWVLREGEGSRWFFDVFQPDGAYLGPIELPVTPELIPPPLVRDGLLAVATTDELGVPYVVMFEVRLPTG